jgi:integrase
VNIIDNMEQLTPAPHFNGALTIGGVKDTLEPMRIKAAGYMTNSRSLNTHYAYAGDWFRFAAWCRQHGLSALPATPATVALYITSLADRLKVSSILRNMAVIGKGHQVEGHPSPCSLKHPVVADTLGGIKRIKGILPDSKAALLTSDLRRMIRLLPPNALGVRDAAVLLLGFAGGFRRSELAALTVGDIERSDDGLKVLLRRSKTYQEAGGRVVGIPFGSDPTCPVHAYERWLEVAGITTGPVFRRVTRHGRIGEKSLIPLAINQIVKRYCERAGLDPRRFGAHSLRSGMCTQAARNGASERSIMRQPGHRSVGMLRYYIREAELFCDNAADSLGL